MISRHPPPHPGASRHPSPARGEGKSAPGGGVEGDGVEGVPHEPSPLAGEGGARRSRGPGEGVRPALKARARELRRNLTDAERALWRLLRDRRLRGAKFRRQVPVGPFIVDFAAFEHRLVVEVDGGQHAGSPRDARRDAWLGANGFRVLRFWNNDVLANPEGVMEVLAGALRRNGEEPRS